MAVVIPIITEFVGKGVERALKEFQQLDGVAAKAGFVFQRALVPGAIAAAGAVTALGGTLFSAAKAAAEAEREDKLLADQLKRTTGATDMAVSSTLAFIDAMEMETTISGGQLSQALATLTRATGDVTTAQDQLALATDIAVAANLDLQSVSTALSKAYNGEFSALKKLGVPIDENIIKTKDYAAVQRLLTEQFGGAAADAADTFTGQLAKLGIGFDRIKEGVGKIILPALTEFLDFVNKRIVPALMVFTEKLGEKGLKGAFVSMAAAFQIAGIDIISVIEKIVTGFLEMAQTIIDVGKPLFVIVDLFRAVAAGGKPIVSTQAAIDNALANSKNKFTALKIEIANTAYQMHLFSQATLNTNQGVIRAEQALDNFGNKVKAVKPEVDETEEKLKNLGGGFSQVEDKAKKLADRTKEAADALRKDMADALAEAQDKLDTAQDAFNEFADTVSGAITSALDFGQAAKDVDMEDFGLGFMEELEAQARKAQVFGERVEALLAAGISEEALNMVLAEGADSGAAIADALLSEAGAVLKANTLVEQTQAIADKIGLAAANKFYKAGVDNGQAYLKGIEDAIATANARLSIAGRPADVKGASALFAETAGAVATATGTTNIYNINSQNLNPKEAGDVIVDALKEYNRRSGPLQLAIE